MLAVTKLRSTGVLTAVHGNEGRYFGWHFRYWQKVLDFPNLTLVGVIDTDKRIIWSRFPRGATTEATVLERAGGNR
jgi:hypothetical protein